MQSFGITYPLEVPAIRIEQPLGEFYVIALPAHVLLKVAYSNPLRIEEAPKSKGWFLLSGTQRPADEQRFIEIARYIKTTEAAFPNSIILGANYRADGTFLNEEPGSELSKLAWTAQESNGRYSIRIPTSQAVAAIIDGQHRLKGFAETGPDYQNMELLCAVYLDLPAPYQAYLFATINFNQKKVDKSLAYQLFGFDVDNEPEDAWPPEKLAVFLSRRLNVEQSSPLRHKIKVSALNRERLEEDHLFQVSTAAVVEGILSLISQNPKADRDLMLQHSVGDGRSRRLLSSDKSPLRELFIAVDDAIIYTLVRNFFQAAKNLLWIKASTGSYIIKTVGIQAIFDVLKEIATKSIIEKDISVERFSKFLSPVADIDFSDNFFQASGKGRVRIRNAMKLALGLVNLQSLSGADLSEYIRICKINLSQD